LLSEGTEKPPYFKNIYGGIKNITPKNALEVEKTMSRILKVPVKLSNGGGGSWDHQMGDRSELYVADDRWDTSYQEFVNRFLLEGTNGRAWLTSFY
jgi:hypothetical protein